MLCRNRREDSPVLRPDGVRGPMAQDVEAPEKVGGVTVDVGSPRPLERLPPAVGGTCRAQTSLGRNVSDSGGLALPQLPVQGAAMLSLSVKR